MYVKYDMRVDNEILFRWKLFAELMVISYQDNFSADGASFRTIDNLEEYKKKEIKETIQDAINTMEAKDINTDEVKELTYNLWSQFNSFVKPNNILKEKDKKEAIIDTSKMHFGEENAAPLQIGAGQHSMTIFVFAWFFKQLCTRGDLNIFIIPLNYFQQTNSPVVKIQLEKKGRQVVCLYGDRFDHTADKSTSYPDSVISTEDCIKSLKENKGRLNN